MKTIKIDLHCHSYYSIDGLSSPKELLQSALKKGLDGIALTDHNNCQGWKEGKKAAEKLGGFFIQGEEIRVRKNGKKIGEILAIFLKKEIKNREIDKVIKEIKEQGGIIILPHPFHFWVGFKDDILKYLPFIDGIEVFNSKGIFHSADKKALAFAQKFNLAMVAGSDAHSASDAGNAYAFCQGKNLEDFKKAILKREVGFSGKKNSLFHLFSPTYLRIRHLLKIPFKKKKFFILL